MTSFRFAMALIAMALVATSTVKATDLTVGTTDYGKEVGSASATRFYNPTSVEVLPGDEVALVADYYNKRIVNMSLVDGSTNEFMTTGSIQPRFLAVCHDGLGYFGYNGVEQFNTSGTPPRTATPWVPTASAHGLACLKNSTHNLLFVADYEVGIRAYDRTNGPPANADDFVWEATVAHLGVSHMNGISLSPDLQHLAFASYDPDNVGTINLETNDPTIYGSGTRGVLNGAANVAQFNSPYGVAWAPDGSKILVNELRNPFSGLRFIDFATGDVTNSASGLMPTGNGFGVTVVRSTGDVVMTYQHGLEKMQVAGVTAGPPTCGNVPTVGHSDSGNSAHTAFGFVGETVTYVCDDEFTTAVGTSQITMCQLDTLTWSTVSDCQSDADVMIAFLGNSTKVKSTLEAVVKALDVSLSAGATSEVSLQAWCQLRDFQ